jgi:hypothetical protein
MIRLALVLPLVIGLVACGGGAANTPAPVGNTGPAPAPSGPVGIPELDQGHFADLAGNGAWDKVVDPSRGVVELRVVASAIDDKLAEKWLKRQCGGDALAAAKTMGDAAATRIGQDEFYDFICNDTGPDAVHCFQRGAAEYDLGYGFDFARTPSGFILTGITTIDVGSAPEDEVAKYDAMRMEPRGC